MAKSKSKHRPASPEVIQDANDNWAARKRGEDVVVKSNLARWLGVSRATLDRWIDAGKIPPPSDPPENPRYWKKSDIEHWQRVVRCEKVLAGLLHVKVLPSRWREIMRAAVTTLRAQDADIEKRSNLAFVVEWLPFRELLFNRRIDTNERPSGTAMYLAIERLITACGRPAKLSEWDSFGELAADLGEHHDINDDLDAEVNSILDAIKDTVADTKKE